MADKNIPWYLVMPLMVSLILLVAIGVFSVFPVAWGKAGPEAMATSNAMLWSRISRCMQGMEERTSDLELPIPWSVRQKELLGMTGPLEEYDSKGYRLPVHVYSEPKGHLRIVMMGQIADSLGLHFAIMQDGTLIKIPPAVIETNK